MSPTLDLCHARRSFADGIILLHCDLHLKDVCLGGDHLIFEMKLALLFVLPSLLNAFVPLAHERCGAKSASSHLFAGSNNSQDERSSSSRTTCIASLATATYLAFMAGPAAAVSGGGLDYANLDITGSPDFANGNFKGKDFTQGAYP